MENSVVIHKVIESIRCSTVADKGKNKEREREGESMSKQTRRVKRMESLKLLKWLLSATLAAGLKAIEDVNV